MRTSVPLDLLPLAVLPGLRPVLTGQNVEVSQAAGGRWNYCEHGLRRCLIELSDDTEK
jgi:hypothetical protein